MQVKNLFLIVFISGISAPENITVAHPIRPDDPRHEHMDPERFKLFDITGVGVVVFEDEEVVFISNLCDKDGKARLDHPQFLNAKVRFAGKEGFDPNRLPNLRTVLRKYGVLDKPTSYLEDTCIEK